MHLYFPRVVNKVFFFPVFVWDSIRSFSRVGELCLPQCPAPGVTARQRRPRPLLQTRSVSSGRGRPRGHPRWPRPQQTNLRRHRKVVIFSHYLPQWEESFPPKLLWPLLFFLAEMGRIPCCGRPESSSSIT